MNEQRRFLISEVCKELGIAQPFIIHCIRAKWVLPFSPEKMELDEEDVARLELIKELKHDFGVNDEAIPIILHLLDQVYFVHGRIQKLQAQISA